MMAFGASRLLGRNTDRPPPRARPPPLAPFKTARTMAFGASRLLGRNAERPLARTIHVCDAIRARIDKADYDEVLAGALHLQSPHRAPSPEPVTERLEARRRLVVRITATRRPCPAPPSYCRDGGPEPGTICGNIGSRHHHAIQRCADAAKEAQRRATHSHPRLVCADAADRRAPRAVRRRGRDRLDIAPSGS